MISVLYVGERLVWGLLTSYLWNLIPTVGNAYRGHLFKLLVSGGHSHCKWIFTHKLCEISLSPRWRPQLYRNRATWKQDDFSFELVTVQLPDAGTSASSFCTTICHSCSKEGWGNSTLQGAVIHPFLGNSCFKENVGSPEGNWPFCSHEGGLTALYFVNPNVTDLEVEPCCWVKTWFQFQTSTFVGFQRLEIDQVHHWDIVWEWRSVS